MRPPTRPIQLGKRRLITLCVLGATLLGAALTPTGAASPVGPEADFECAAQSEKMGSTTFGPSGADKQSKATGAVSLDTRLYAYWHPKPIFVDIIGYSYFTGTGDCERSQGDWVTLEGLDLVSVSGFAEAKSACVALTITIYRFSVDHSTSISGSLGASFSSKNGPQVQAGFGFSRTTLPSEKETTIFASPCIKDPTYMTVDYANLALETPTGASKLVYVKATLSAAVHLAYPDGSTEDFALNVWGKVGGPGDEGKTEPGNACWQRRGVQPMKEHDGH